MSQKKDEAVAIPAPEMSSKINMNLSQDDLINLVIDEQLDILEARMEELETRINGYDALHKEVKDYIFSQIRTSVTKSADYKKFKKVVKDLDLKADKPHFRGGCWDYSRNKDDDQYQLEDSYDWVNMERLESYKNPTSKYIERCRSKRNIGLSLVRNVTVNCHARGGGFDLVFDKTIKLSAPLWKKEKEMHTKIFKDHLQYRRMLHDTQVEYIKIKYGAQRMKSKLIKASLAQTEEGRSILEHLQNATNIKMLG